MPSPLAMLIQESWKRKENVMDAYDHAVAWLTERQWDIFPSWNNANDCRAISHPARILFADVPGCAGCLTQLRAWPFRALGNRLGRLIVADERIPNNEFHITPASLPVFAEWQRRLDKELGRTPPVWKEPENV